MTSTDTYKCVIIFCIICQAGDILEVTGKVDDEWAMGKLDQNEGIFPIVFIDKMPDKVALITKEKV